MEPSAEVVTAAGSPLQPAITIPATASSVTFGRDGTVSVELSTGGQQVLGRVQLARFMNPAGLQSLGQNLMKETPASGVAQVLIPGVNGAGSLMQGTLEASNVNVVEEMVNMIETQRAYEINSKAIAAVDGMLKYLNQNM
jgi:flagellar basal-body rod protein FlgG